MNNKRTTLGFGMLILLSFISSITSINSTLEVGRLNVRLSKANSTIINLETSMGKLMESDAKLVAASDGLRQADARLKKSCQKLQDVVRTLGVPKNKWIE